MGQIYLGYYSIIAAVILIGGSFALVVFKRWYNDRQTNKKDIHRLLVIRELQPNDGKSLVDKVNKQGRQIEEIYCMLKDKKPVET